ncbi:Tyrosine-protein phosphatase SIW14 [Hondaea fermentalgiana]|uniref:diphosphoinositol-polyphosphate diphosphatase n=1 Tax=Hondaea fermentalgiana TaxID=2315210 RepID=A0A2R5GHM4_9STRA|nr:Tyrosine-protein phosphatase SIW14 [Hondaea fermentalgiana]|eukprot:GBG30396.1 Tyrosine-protein phosphatase SIW14 [Hondaea fermentalgiana]
MLQSVGGVGRSGGGGGGGDDDAATADGEGRDELAWAAASVGLAGKDANGEVSGKAEDQGAKREEEEEEDNEKDDEYDDENEGSDEEGDEVFLDVPQVSRDKLLIPPLNFAMVAKGVFRSGYPNAKNFSFIKHLKIRTMICMSAEEAKELKIGEENREFVALNGIRLLRFPLEGQKEPFSQMSHDTIRRALREVLDVRNHPVLIHCDKGKHRTGTIVGCLRKLQGYALSGIFQEYSRFCKQSVRLLDHQLMEFFTMDFTPEERLFLPSWLPVD